MKHRSLLAAAMLFSTGLVSAQGLHENIGVEGKYVREVIVQDRINTLPSRLNFTFDTEPLSYELMPVEAFFRPDGNAMPIATPFVKRLLSRNRGYVNVSAGMWLNSDLSAGYKFVDNDRWEAGIWLQHNSTSLFKPKLSEQTRDVSRFRYDERIGVYGSRKFAGKGTLEAIVSYHSGYFNYYGYNPNVEQKPGKEIKAPTQTLNDITGRLEWKSALPGKDNVKYSAALDVRYFGYRSLYLPAIYGEVTRDKGLRETHLDLSGRVMKPWKNGSSIGLDLQANALFYTGPDSHEFVLEKEDVTLQSPDNYGSVTLTPYYRFSKGKLNIRVGVDIDLTFNAGNKGERYGAFKAAPDVKLDWRTGIMGLYLNLTGGSDIQTLAMMHDNDYYNLPTLSTTRPVYTPLDAKLGFNFGPMNGFGAGVSVSYRISNHVPLIGWYTEWLNNGFEPVSALEGYNALTDRGVSYSCDTRGMNLHGMSIGAHLSYTLGNILELRASGTYQPQNGETGYYNGPDRARWTAEIRGEVNPVKNLSIYAGYLYRGVRRIYTRCYSPAVTGLFPGTDVPIVDESKYAEPHPASLRLGDLTDLRVGASYQITPKIKVYVNALNILGRKTDWLPELPLEGVNVTGGVSILF